MVKLIKKHKITISFLVDVKVKNSNIAIKEAISKVVGRIDVFNIRHSYLDCPEDIYKFEEEVEKLLKDRTAMEELYGMNSAKSKNKHIVRLRKIKKALIKKYGTYFNRLNGMD